MDRSLVVGLGNPGPRYARNRHNVGFMVVDELARGHGISLSRSKFNGSYGTGSVGGRPAVLLEPQTFMNLSGQSVRPALDFFQVEIADLVVIHDEIDLPFGTLRLKTGGGHAGHNGLRSIIAETGQRDFVRLRVGVGRPRHGEVADYVLSDFGSDEQPWLADLVERAAAAVRLVLEKGVRKAMNDVNQSVDTGKNVG